VGGTQDNGTHRYRGTMTFDQVQGGDGMWTAIDWVNPGVWYASYYSLAMTRSRGARTSAASPQAASTAKRTWLHRGRSVKSRARSSASARKSVASRSRRRAEVTGSLQLVDLAD